MTSSELSPRFVVFVVVSLLTHLLELAASGLLCHVIMRQDSLRTPWLSVAAGLLIIPLVAVQLASAVCLLRRKGEAATGCETTTTAVLHVLQLGFISRHFAILQDAPLASKRAEVAEMLLLRMAFAFTSGCTLGLLQAYLVLRDAHDPTWAWAVGLVAGVTLLSITWALTNYRRALPETSLDLGLVTWPGTPLKMLWRAGEVLTRLLALGLFASLYKQWVFLVLGLHWIAMLACVCIPAMTSLDWRSTGCLRRATICLMTSFAYIFAFLNTSGDNAVFRYTFFYVMLFLENTTLVTVWLVQCSSQEMSRNFPFVIAAAIAFITSIVSMIVYHKFFHVPLDDKTTVPVAVSADATSASCGSASCVSCKHSNKAPASVHPPIPPRPGVAGTWLNQYQSAVYCGQYYKHTVQDSLLDSISDLNSSITVSSTHARLQQKLAAIDDEAKNHDSGSSNSRQRSSCQQKPSRQTAAVKEEISKSKSPKNKWRKRSPSKKKDKGEKTDSDMMSSTTDADHSEDSNSPKRPVWLPSGDSAFANQLLFDAADTADDERSSVATGNQGPRNVEPSSLSPRDIVTASHAAAQKSSQGHVGAAYQSSGEHHWYSDGYSTDRTLDWPGQLQERLWGSGGIPGQHDSDPDCYNCDCLHRDSEFSSIMCSISPAAPTDDVQGRHQCLHHNHHHHNIHQLPHHRYLQQQHRHRSGAKGLQRSHQQQSLHSYGCEDRTADCIDCKDTLTPLGLDRIQEQPMPRPHKDTKSELFTGRSPRLPSPASDPSYGPKSKKKHSPRRKQHTLSSRPDKSTSSTSTSQQAQTSKANSSHLPQTNVSILDADSEFRQNDRLARELLQTPHLAEAESGSATKISDPRFTVRVMTATSRENGNSSENKQLAPDKDCESQHGSKNVSNTSAKNIAKEDNKKTSLSRSKAQHESKASSVSDSDKAETAPDSTSISAPSQTSGSTSAGDVIYENIWQAEHIHRGKKPRGSTGEQTNLSGETMPARSKHGRIRTAGSAGRDPWYVCSESEDSALPPEALSSSVDGFTASDNDSDVSVEIVI
ncbi:Xk-related protein [Plakobranchus ocellatus]|uniref:XK-related protein n=1 Tax=Plakobranchus ocellatus TaxID=259542 RepID=A0AAV4DVB9_9GAST|nr:Xk-related protein [Plakobranchus ocellatus]